MLKSKDSEELVEKGSREASRKCLGCGSVKPKEELIRFALRDSCLVSGDMSGRGAYLCRDKECVRLASKNKGVFSRAFKASVKAVDENELWALAGSLSTGE